MRNVPGEKNCRENQNTFYSQIVFPENDLKYRHSDIAPVFVRRHLWPYIVLRVYIEARRFGVPVTTGVKLSENI
jgi:hypothetical protein